jgi:hypothetical protein
VKISDIGGEITYFITKREAVQKYMVRHAFTLCFFNVFNILLSRLPVTCSPKTGPSTMLGKREKRLTKELKEDGKKELHS